MTDDISGPTIAHRKARARAARGADQSRRNPMQVALARGDLGADATEAALLREDLAWFMQVLEVARNPESTGQPWGAVEDGCRRRVGGAAGVGQWRGPAGGGRPFYTATPHALQGQAQHYTRARQIERLVKIRMGVLWRPFRAALEGATMKSIGECEGAGASTAAAKGCMRVTDALRTLAVVREFIRDTEARNEFLPPNSCAAIGDGAEALPASWRNAANDMRRKGQVA